MQPGEEMPTSEPPPRERSSWSWSSSRRSWALGQLFEEEGVLQGKPSSSCGVAMVFLPQAADEASEAMALLERQAKDKGFEFLGWRDPPQNKAVLGEMALEALPNIQQAPCRRGHTRAPTRTWNSNVRVVASDCVEVPAVPWHRENTHTLTKTHHR